MLHTRENKFLTAALAVLLGTLLTGVTACQKKPASSSLAAQDAIGNAESGADTGVEVEGEVTEENNGAENVIQFSQTQLAQVHFDFDSYRLSADAKRTIRDNYSLLTRQYPNSYIRLEGHCDERGSNAYNLSLGEKRARSVKNYLSSLGLSTDRIDLVSYGEERPLDSRSTESAWRVNRRVEFVIRNVAGR